MVALVQGDMKMKLYSNPKGVSLIAAIFIIVILAFMGVMFVTLINTGSFTSVNDLQSAQALYVAEGGAQAAKYQMSTGTTCTNLTNTNVPLGPGTFTTSGAIFTPAATTLNGAIPNPTTTTIPVISTLGYAPQGRITITDPVMGNETIWYGRIAGNSFINARRGVAGTTANAHATGLSVSQNQCRITSTGSVGAASRVVLADVAGSGSSGGSGGKSSASLDHALTPISNVALTDIGTLSTTLIPGDNLIIAVVLLQNTSGVVTDISAGNLQLRSGATVLAQNRNLIRVVGTTTPGGANNNFPQETQFFLYRDTGATANPTYGVVAQATQNNRISAAVKMVVFNNVSNAYFSDPNVRLTNAANGAVLATHATGLPAGDTVILAAVELDNTVAGTRTVTGGAPGNLKLRKGTGTGATLVSNLVTIGLENTNNANRGTGYLLIARDTTGAANQTYSVTGQASNNNSIWGAVRMLVLQGQPFANLSTGQVNITNAVTTWGSMATTFPAGDNIVLSSTQYYNANAAARSVLIDRLINGITLSSNVVPIYLGGGTQQDDYATGLLLFEPNALANPTYNWQSQANTATDIQADTEMIGIHLPGAVVDFGSQ
jgi:Tfp pilus assembly protein PilX